MLGGVNSKRRAGYAAGLAFFFLAMGGASATTFTVDVAPGGQLVFSPASVSIQVGDTVKWTWKTIASPLGRPVIRPGCSTPGPTARASPFPSPSQTRVHSTIIARLMAFVVE